MRHQEGQKEGERRMYPSPESDKNAQGRGKKEERKYRGRSWMKRVDRTKAALGNI